MALTCPNVGEVLMLKSIVNHTALGNLKLHLFTNNATVAEATVIGDLTEATGNGYAAITLTGGSWTVSTAGGVSTASYASQTFTFSGVGTYYGYYLTDNAGTGLLWVEKFSSAFTFDSAGGSIAFAPAITLE